MGHEAVLSVHGQAVMLRADQGATNGPPKASLHALVLWAGAGGWPLQEVLFKPLIFLEASHSTLKPLSSHPLRKYGACCSCHCCLMPWGFP